MQVIGITGGVGSGKSRVTYFISEITGFPVFEADRVAHEVMEPGTACCAEIVRVFGEEILAEDGSIDRKKLGAVVFGDAEKIGRLNAIVHPAVHRSVEKTIETAARGSLLVLESALLLEEDYGEMCDAVWYVYADPDKRRQRLLESRGYSADRTAQIMAKQRSDAYFRGHCDLVIDNSSDDVENTYVQVDAALQDLLLIKC